MVPVSISFDPVIGHDTRADESIPFPQDRTFKVWALNEADGSVLIDAEEVSYGTEGWISSYIWPEATLAFDAFSPSDLPFEYSKANGLTLRDFDCSKGDTDILVAHKPNADKQVDNPVILPFEHILSRVEFRMMHSLSETMSVRLKKIEMIGFARKGDYNIKKKDGWSVGAYDYSYVVYDAGEGEGIDITAGYAKYIGEEFYVIPQPCTASLEVTYDIRYDNANWLPQTEVIDNLETFLEPSKHYTYTVNLRMDKLTHTTGISSWNNQ
jgi:hypothetical protein